MTNGCCPSGHSPCGSNSCYDSKSAICCGSSGRSCPKGHDCMEDGQFCCRSGLKKCGTSKSCYDPATSICCTDQTGSSWACSVGSTCGSERDCIGTQAPPPMTTKSEPALAVPTLDSPQTKTETIRFVYDPNRQVRATAGPNAGSKVTAPNKGAIMNMCEGIKVRNGQGGNKLQLTHGGKEFTKKNRKEMCGESDCRNALNEYIQLFYPDGIPPWAQEAITVAGDLQCDEFPFASSVEGGNKGAGVTKCVPADDNRWQGGTMSSYFNSRNKKYIRPGETYFIEIVGWDCDKQAPTKRSTPSLLIARDAFTSADGVKRTGGLFRFMKRS